MLLTSLFDGYGKNIHQGPRQVHVLGARSRARAFAFARIARYTEVSWPLVVTEVTRVNGEY